MHKIHTILIPKGIYAIQKALLIARNRELRNRRTNGEALLWYFLKDKAFCKRKFNRQFKMGSYMVDFICVEKKLIIELDKKPYDETQTLYFKNEGYKVLRYTNDEIFLRLKDILDEIAMGLKSRSISSPSPFGRRGSKGE